MHALPNDPVPPVIRMFLPERSIAAPSDGELERCPASLRRADGSGGGHHGRPSVEQPLRGTIGPVPVEDPPAKLGLGPAPAAIAQPLERRSGGVERLVRVQIDAVREPGLPEPVGHPPLVGDDRNRHLGYAGACQLVRGQTGGRDRQVDVVDEIDEPRGLAGALGGRRSNSRAARVARRPGTRVSPISLKRVDVRQRLF